MAMTLEGPVADRHLWQDGHCSISRAMEAVGARATVLVLREAFYGTTRFDDFVSCTGLSESVTAARLKQLVDMGALERHPYRDPGSRLRHEYVLTTMGRDLLPAVLALMQWADKYLQAEGGPVRIVERGSGEPVTVAPRTESGGPLGLDDLAVVANNDGTWVAARTREESPAEHWVSSAPASRRATGAS